MHVGVLDAVFAQLDNDSGSYLRMEMKKANQKLCLELQLKTGELKNTWPVGTPSVDQVNSNFQGKPLCISDFQYHIWIRQRLNAGRMKLIHPFKR